MISIDAKSAVRQIFTDFIEKKGLRKTPERYTILDEIYSISGEFDVDFLCLLLKEKKYPISRATVYNTIDLLLDCNLLIKHQYGKNIGRFERTFDNAHRHHLICSVCGQVIEFTDPRTKEIQNTVEHLIDFKVSYHSLYFYGSCKDCSENSEQTPN